jgi:hypothetical protein
MPTDRTRLDHYADLSTRLSSLRRLFLGETAPGYLGLFDEFLEHAEFGLALETLCDFLLESVPRLDGGDLAQIEALYALMEMDDTCVSSLRVRLGSVEKRT